MAWISYLAGDWIDIFRKRCSRVLHSKLEIVLNGGIRPHGNIANMPENYFLRQLAHITFDGISLAKIGLNTEVDGKHL